MISHDEFMDITREWVGEEQLVFLAENSDWFELLFNVIKERWDEVKDTMEISCIEAFAKNHGLAVHIPRDE